MEYFIPSTHGILEIELPNINQTVKTNGAEPLNAPRQIEQYNLVGVQSNSVFVSKL